MKKKLEKWVIKNWGERCETTDWEDFPEIKGKRDGEGVCACCEAWRCYTYLMGLEEDEQ